MNSCLSLRRRAQQEVGDNSIMISLMVCSGTLLVQQHCWYNRESYCWRQLRAVRLKFHCQLHFGEPLESLSGKDRQRNWKTDAGSRVIERCR